MSAVDRYPLQWPSGWKRTPASRRESARFSKSETRYGQKQDGTSFKTVDKRQVNASDATMRLESELDRLGARNATLSTNMELRLDGRPKSNVSDPPDTGAAVYFTLNGQQRCLACDKWNRVADNIAALAAHIDALRRIDRYGVGTSDQAFAGYVGLPAKGETWRTTLGFDRDETISAEMIERAFRTRARDAHPDAVNGSHDAMASLTQARSEGLMAIGAARAMEAR